MLLRQTSSLSEAPACSQQGGEGRQQAQSYSPPAEGSSRHSRVTQVGVTAHVGVVEVQARGVFLSAHATLGGDGAALLIHGQLQRTYEGKEAWVGIGPSTCIDLDADGKCYIIYSNVGSLRLIYF